MDFVEDLHRILADLREFVATRPKSSFARDQVPTLDAFHEIIVRLEK
jgi:hypothetical protein